MEKNYLSMGHGAWEKSRIQFCMGADLMQHGKGGLKQGQWIPKHGLEGNQSSPRTQSWEIRCKDVQCGGCCEPLEKKVGQSALITKR